MIIEVLKAILFGVVEGITEWLPVSSTGHMILLENWVHFTKVSDEFWKMFEVVIQLGAILAVVVIFWEKLWPWRIKNVKVKGKMAIEEKVVFKDGALDMWCKIILACIPAAVVGLALDDWIDRMFYHPIPVAIALIVVGILFIVIEATSGKRAVKIHSIQEMSYPVVLLIGVAQTIAAVFPGTSRSGATIIGALLLGVSREVAAEFTFFLAVPVMFGASLLKAVKYMVKGMSMGGMEWVILLTGCVVAFAVSIIIINFLMGYIKKHDFKIFGGYRILLGILVIALLHG
ncbi:undecaprenyl-diphosphatase [Lachnospiraceae bacterium C10]|nr:undecaprenyl-diphosphatase [Lachnospiraceae bacterium C10]